MGGGEGEALCVALCVGAREVDELEEMGVVEFDLKVVARALDVGGVEGVEECGNVVGEVPEEMLAFAVPVDAAVGRDVAPAVVFRLSGGEGGEQAIGLFAEAAEVKMENVGDDGGQPSATQGVESPKFLEFLGAAADGFSAFS